MEAYVLKLLFNPHMTVRITWQVVEAYQLKLPAFRLTRSLW